MTTECHSLPLSVRYTQLHKLCINFQDQGCFWRIAMPLTWFSFFYALSNKKKSFSNILYHLPLKTVNLDGVY